MGKAEVIVGLLSLFILEKVQLSSTLAMNKDAASMSKSNQEAAEHVKLGHELSSKKVSSFSFSSIYLWISWSDRINYFSL